MLTAAKKATVDMFDKRITLGNVIEIVVLLVAIVTAYSRLQTSQATVELQLAAQKVQTDEIKSSYVRADLHKIQMDTINEKLADISSDIKEIKKEVKK